VFWDRAPTKLSTVIICLEPSLERCHGGLREFDFAHKMIGTYQWTRHVYDRSDYCPLPDP